MLRANNRPLLVYFDSIKNLRVRQLNLILKSGFDPNLFVNARGQNGLQYMINYFGATDAHYRLQVPMNRAAYLSIARLLIDSGLDPNAIDLLTGETVLFDAIRFNDKDLVILLLNYADFSIRNKDGETALMCAARFGSKQVMRMILEQLRHLDMDGYFLRQRNRFGLTALELARGENLECAKVLTKHLIAYGHHSGSVLSRSTSHHQLRSMLPYGVRAAALNARPSGRAALIDDSASDYSDVDVLAYHPPAVRGSISRALATGYKTGSGLYDPKAAEFNQYLLEQQELLTAGESSAEGLTGRGAGLTATMSDDDDYFAIGEAAGTSGLTRSRSCMLGPTAIGSSSRGNQVKQNKHGDESSPMKAKSVNERRKLSAWEGPNANDGRGNVN